MKKTMKNYWMWLVACLLLASCGTNKYSQITQVHPDQQVLGKGVGQELTVQSHAIVKPQQNQKVALMPAPEFTVSQGVPFVASIKETGAPAALSAGYEATMKAPVPKVELDKKFKKKLLRKYYLKTLAAKVFGSSESMNAEISDLALIIIAIFLPPLAVGLKVGITTPFWINLILTLLFWLPGFIHAVIVILRE